MAATSSRIAKRTPHAPIEFMEPRYLLAGGVDRLVNDNAGAAASQNFTQSALAAYWHTGADVSSRSTSGGYGCATHFTGFARSIDGGVNFTDGGESLRAPRAMRVFPTLAPMRRPAGCT